MALTIAILENLLWLLSKSIITLGSREKRITKLRIKMMSKFPLIIKIRTCLRKVIRFASPIESSSLIAQSIIFRLHFQKNSRLVYDLQA